MVDEQYERTSPTDIDGVLRDQFKGEISAYRFYDSLIDAMEESDVEFAIERHQLLSTLTAIRDDELEDVQEVLSILDG